METVYSALQQHLEKFTSCTKEEFVSISKYFRQEEVKKKSNVLVEGQTCTKNYFVVRGCMRKFFVDRKGTEHTTEFAIENWWITDLLSYEHRRPSEFYLQAVENCTVLTLDRNVEQELLYNHTSVERYFRCIYQRAYASAQMRMKYLYDLSKEEFYHHLNDHYPEFVQRIPQYLVASYLGFTPEYLSEIRAKRRS